MLKIISYWSVRDGIANTRPVEEAMDEAKAAGFDGVELAVGETGVLSVTTDQGTCQRYRAAAEERGLALQTVACAVTWGCSPTSNDEATRQRSIQLHCHALQRVAWLGAQAMLFVPGAVKIPWDHSYGPVKYDNAVKWARQAVKRVGEVAQKLKVDLCVENVWNGMFYSPLEFRDFIDQFKSKRIGVYFDVGNVLGYHQHPPHWIEILGRRIKRVHIKDFKRDVGNLSGFCDLLAGDVPWKQTMAALRKIKYDKTIVAEMMPPEATLLQRTKKAMDRIFAM